MPDTGFALPFLDDDDPVFRAEFESLAQRVTMEAGQFIFMEADQCTGLPVVVDGTARVYKMSESGRELTLYRIEGGDSCILTASCLASGRRFPAFAVAETDLEAWFVPASVYRSWLDKYPRWRQYVFDLIASRIGSVIELVEEIAFRGMDARLAGYLVEEADRGTEKVVARTHEGIATDLGTSREVVSRLLKEFEKLGMVELTRGAVRITELNKLAAIGRNRPG